MNLKLLANTYLLLALVLGALLPVMLDFASGSNLAGFLFYTYLISVFVSLLLIVSTKRTGRLIAYFKNVKDFLLIAFIGLLNYALLEYGITYAEKFVSASLATVVYRTSPILMLIFLPLILRERVTKYQLLALVLGFVGLYIAISGGTLSFAYSGNSLIVIFLIFVALAGALATVLVKKYSFDMITGMFIFNLANMLFFGAVFLASGAYTVTFSTNEIIALLYVGIIYNVFVGFMYYDSFRMLKSTFVTNIYFLSPFITFLFAGIILGEAIKIYYIVIALLVAVGIIIQKFDKLGSTYSPKENKHKNYTIFDVTSAFVNTQEDVVYNVIKSGGRVLAINVSGKPKHFVESAMNIPNGGLLVYTDSHKFVRNEEREFVRDIIGAKEGDSVIMCAGQQEQTESALFSIMEKLESGENTFAMPNSQQKQN